MKASLILSLIIMAGMALMASAAPSYSNRIVAIGMRHAF